MVEKSPCGCLSASSIGVFHQAYLYLSFVSSRIDKEKREGPDVGKKRKDIREGCLYIPSKNVNIVLLVNAARLSAKLLVISGVREAYPPRLYTRIWRHDIGDRDYQSKDRRG